MNPFSHPRWCANPFSHLLAGCHWQLAASVLLRSSTGGRAARGPRRFTHGETHNRHRGDDLRPDRSAKIRHIMHVLDHQPVEAGVGVDTGLFGRPVDLLTRRSVEHSPNKYFRRFALRRTEPIYERG